MGANNERERNALIPLIYTFFCLCVTIGGVLLVIHVFFPSLSRPWHPIAALVLIGSTWIFWLLTYIYACIKACFARRQIKIAAAKNASAAAVEKDATGQKQGGKKDSSIAPTDSAMPLAYAA